MNEMDSVNKPEGGFRRSSAEIFAIIYNALPVESKITITQLAKETGLDWATTKRHLDMIELIEGFQKGDWLIKEPVRGQRQSIYGRRRK